MTPFIYALADPRTPEHLRYIGMSIRPDRPFDHIKATRKSKRKSHLYSWIRLLLADGQEPIVSVVEQCDEGISRKCLGERERYHIKRLRDDGHRLTNMTEGGEGGATFKGRQHSIQSRANMSAAKKGRKTHDQTPETRAKIGNANKGLKRSPEVIEKYRAAQKGRVSKNKGKKFVSDEDASYGTLYRRGIGARRIYRKVTPEIVREIRAAWPRETLRAIAKRLNISSGSVYCIAKNQRWTEVI